MQIWKKQLVIAAEQDINVPHNATFLYVAEQAGVVCLWFECNPNAFTCVRHIRIYGTGHHMSESPHEYIGSVVDSDGFVWHVFEALV